jgi:hypothetical protein
MMDPILVASVHLITNHLSDQELVALYNVATAGFNPIHIMGYDKFSSLFTEYDGTRMNAATLEILDTIVAKRIK